jgi:DNA-binding transcriptional LysR family regulator
MRIAAQTKTPFRQEQQLDRLHMISVFVTVVDEQGLAGAARKLRMSPPAVTRAINELEADLGARLLTRTTRVVRVTEAGAAYAEHCRRILADLAEADESVTGVIGAPRGALTITAPVVFGAMHVTPIVTEYLGRYPEVTASCWFLDRVVNLIEEGVDVGVRIGALPDSSMQAIRVGNMRLVICASPAYLEKNGTPKVPADLDGHVIIAGGSVTSETEWRVMESGKLRTVNLKPRMTTLSSDSAVAAAVSGFGLTNALYYKVAEHVNAGRLVTLLGKFEPAALPVHVLHREGRHASKKVRAFIDLAIERLRANPALS